MTNDEIKNKVIEILGNVVPELEPATLKPDRNIRDQLDIDSMDFLNFVTALHKGFGVDVPETDYQKIFTIDGCVAYLAARLRTA
jgi:acyl carrier protein